MHAYVVQAPSHARFPYCSVVRCGRTVASYRSQAERLTYQLQTANLHSAPGVISPIEGVFTSGVGATDTPSTGAMYTSEHDARVVPDPALKQHNFHKNRAIKLPTGSGDQTANFSRHRVRASKPSDSSAISRV